MLPNLVDWSVIPVHPGIGSGAGFMGWAFLLARLNSCLPRVAVVKIDNGFRARYLAALIDRKD